MIYGYARVSFKNESFEDQIRDLEDLGVDDENIFMETALIKKNDKPEFKDMMDRLNKGDTLIIQKMDRLFSSTKNLINIITTLDTKGVRFISIQEKIDSKFNSKMNFYEFIRKIHDFERDVISECTKLGIQKSKAFGQKSGRKPVNSEKINYAIKLYKMKKFNIDEIEITSGVSKSTLYRYLKNENKLNIIKE